VQIQRIEDLTSIADGTIVILVQDGRARVARYIQPRAVSEFASYTIAFNAADLESDAMNCLRASLGNADGVFTCPVELACQAQFRGVRRCV
jgi:hypothetical protein